MAVFPELIVTDFAGTTMADHGVVLAAYRDVLSAFEIPFTEQELADRRGASKRAVFKELAARAHPEMADEIAEEALASFEQTLRRKYEASTAHEIPGAGDALDRLRKAGIKLALTSGFERDLIDHLLRKLGWTALFDAIVGSDEVPAGRPAPFLIYRAMMLLDVYDVSRVAVVGDTPLDLVAGHNARAGWIIGVLSGAHGVETLGVAPHTHLLSSIADLPELIS